MKYYIIAGEASGDLHGANLITALMHGDPDARIRYWGGDRMAAAVGDRGEQVRHIRDLAYMGIVEVVSHLGTVLGNIRLCKKDIMDFHPDVIIYVDYPGFNLKVAKWAHKQGFKNLYYISPQVWAWKRGRLRAMRRDLDLLCYILPSERKFYTDGVMDQAVYVGHPLLDEVLRYREASCEATRPDGAAPTIALLPGSRKQELARVLPAMMRLAQRHPECRFQVAGMTLIGEDYYRKYIPQGVTNVEVLYNQMYDILADAYAAVVCSGTATLETALFNVPQVVCYQCNKLSAALVRPVLTRHIKYISLPNLIADAPVVSELIQDDYNDGRLELEFKKITIDDANRRKITEGYAAMRDEMGGDGASRRVASKAIGLAKNGH